MGADHPDTALGLNNLALLYRAMGRYSKAEPLYVRYVLKHRLTPTLAIREQQLGADHPDTAGSLFNLAALYYNTQRYPQAFAAIQRAVQIYHHTLGAHHPTTQAAYSWLQVIQQAVEANPD